MSSIKTYPFQNSTILRIYSEKDAINEQPLYQRNGGVWTQEKKQLLIDSILNDYDIPKLYFHNLNSEQRREYNNSYSYAIIDGRQRIETIWEFINGEFPISDDFEYQADPSVRASGLTYSDLAVDYPKLKIRFDSYILPVTVVETDDVDLIEDMFSRLNEAMPLNAAEKRNAKGGNMARVIREITQNDFFRFKVKFNNNRYQHQEVAARLLFLIYSIENNGKILDTKKPFLDKMVVHYKDNPDMDPQPIKDQVSYVLEVMNSVFASADILLRSQSNTTLYFLLFREAIAQDVTTLITRQRLLSFYDELEANRKIAEQDITLANFDYLEFERLSQQGTNDANSIKERTKILGKYIGINTDTETLL